MDMQEYLAKRQKLADLYDGVKLVAQQLGSDGIAQKAEAAKQALLQDGFNLVVVGEFSRGKSTFINAMLGKRVLPAKSNPTTTIINRITYGQTPEYILHKRDGSSPESIDEKAFKAITAAECLGDSEEDLAEYQEACNRAASIEYAEIRYPLDICRNGIELVDTPGTNDLDQAREEITFKFIPQADAAIMLLNATQIASKSELDFLRERICKNDIQKVFFVVNRKDSLENEDEEQRVMATAREQLGKIVPNPRIYMVSAKLALNYRRRAAGEEVKGIVPDTMAETGFENFEAALAQYLVQERAQFKLGKYVSRLVSLARELQTGSIALKLANIGQSSAELKRQIEVIKPKIQRSRQQSSRVFEMFRRSLELSAGSYAHKYRRGLENISRKAAMNVNMYDGPMNGDALARSVEAEIAPLQQEHEQEINRDLNRYLNDELDNVREKLKKIFMTEDLLSGCRSLVPVDSNLPAAEVALDLGDINTNDSILAGGGLLLGGLILAVHAPIIAIPAAIFGGGFIKEQFNRYRRADFVTQASRAVKKRYDDIIPEQESRFKEQLEYRLRNTVANISNLIQGQLDTIEDNLQQLLEEKNRAQDDENRQRQELQAHSDKLTNIQRQAEAL